MSDPIDPGTVVLTATAELNGIEPDGWTEGTHFELAVRLARTEHLIELLKEREEWLRLILAESMEADEEVVSGVGVLKRHKRDRSTWRYPEAGNQMREDLASAVAREVALDVATGEMDPMKRNVALAALRTAYEAIPSFSSLKVTGSKRLGLKLWDYRKSDEYYTVTLEDLP